MKNPCFDEVTRTDCPRRYAGCVATCPEWAEYEKERAARTAKNKRIYDGNCDYHAIREVRSELYRKHHLRIPRSHKK